MKDLSCNPTLDVCNVRMSASTTHDALMTALAGADSVVMRLPFASDAELEWLVLATRDLDHELPLLLIESAESKVSPAEALRAGADDYVRLPLDPDEILARVEAVRRRCDGFTPLFKAGNVECVGSSKTFWIGRHAATFGTSYSETLLLLMKARGQVVSQESLAAHNPALRGATPATIACHISRLRRRIEEVGANVEIISHYRSGYSIKYPNSP